MQGHAASQEPVANCAHHADELVEPLLGTDLCTTDLCTEQMHDMKLNE